MAYEYEFKQLNLKLDYQGEIINHNIIRLKDWLNKDISLCMTIHKFEIIGKIFQAALEI